MSGFPGLQASVNGWSNAASQAELADMDHDGHPDLVVGNASGMQIAVYPNTDGSGSFSSSPLLLGGDAGSLAFAVGDLNGDGWPDLAVASTAPNGARMIFNKAMGSFSNSQELQVSTTPVGVAVADLNHDGWNDVALTTSSVSTVDVWFHLTDGGWSSTQTFAMSGQPGWLASGDLDGDGWADLVANDVGSGGIHILYGLHDGGLGNEHDHAGCKGRQRVLLVDLDRDGRPDVVVSCDDGTATGLVYLDGRLDSPLPLNPGVTLGELASGDFDRDGIPDLVARATGTVFLGNGDGTFRDAGSYLGGGSPSFATGIAVGDVDGDGRLDALLVEPTQLTELLGEDAGVGTGGFSVGASIPEGYPSAVAVCDLNGDGWPDVVATSHNFGAAANVALNGPAGFSVPASYSLGENVVAVGIGDFNGDGLPDLVTGWPDQADTSSSADGGIELLLNAGDGGFYQAGIWPLGTTVDGLAVADFTHDGWPDVVILNAGVGVTLLAWDPASGTFAAPVQDAIYKPFDGMAVGDFNRDGRPDVVLTSGFGHEIDVIRDGSWTTYFPTSVAGAYPGPIAAGDLDGDGNTDVVTADTIDGHLNVLLGNGTLYFADAGLYSPLPASLPDAGAITPHALQLVDVDGDGKPDIVFSGYPPVISVLLNLGAGRFGPALAIDHSVAPYALASGDFNRDGRADLAAAAELSTRVQLYQGVCR